VIIIDTSHLFFRNFWRLKKDIIEYAPNEDGISVPTGEINAGFLISAMCSSILLLTNKFKASKTNEVILALDAKPSWRHDYYIQNTKEMPEYKGQTYKGDRVKSTEFNWSKIFEAFDEAMNAIDEMSDFKVLKVDLAEADDIVAILARNCPETEDVFICSSDKDFHQLQRKNIHIYDPVQKIIIPPINIERHQQLHFMLAGDDNLKQIKKGVGIKTAEKILEEGLDLYLQTNPEMKMRYDFNQRMIDFDYIPKDVVKSILLCYNNYNGGKFNATKLMTFFSKHRMKKMAMRSVQFKTKERTDTFKIVDIEDRKSVVETSIQSFFS